MYYLWRASVIRITTIHFAGIHHSFALTLLARAVMALGAGGGLKMAF